MSFRTTTTATVGGAVVLLAGAGFVAVPAQAAPVDWGDSITGRIIWDSLDKSTKARVCHAYWSGGKRAIRTVVTVGKGPNNSNINWSSQKPFQKVVVAKCDRRASKR